MKKRIFLLLIISFTFLFLGCKSKATLKINGNDSVLEGEQIQLTLETNLEKYTPKWSVSDDNIATVDSTGLVTGLKKGNVVITLIVGKTKTTKNLSVAGFNVEINFKSYITIDEEIKLVVTHNSDKEKKVFFSSLNEEIATVDNNGVVKGVSLGKARITISVMGFLRTIEINVVDEKDIPEENPDDPTENPDDPTENPDEPTPPTIDPLIIDAPDFIRYDDLVIVTANRDVIWSSSDENILMINEFGELIILDMGEVVIRATDANNKDAYVEKKVFISSGIAPSSIEIYQSEGIYEIENKVVLGFPQNLQLKVKVIGNKQYDSRVYWSIDQPKIATIDERGVLTPVSGNSKGSYKVVVTATSVVDSTIKDDVIITVIFR